MLGLFPLTRAASPYHSDPHGHAGVTVPLYETLSRTESNNHGKQPSMIYRIVISP
jgi:hypothetical protein